MDERRRQLLELILAVSFEHRPVKLSSGKQSDFYLDLRQTLMRPLGQKLAGELLLGNLMVGSWVDSVGGMAVGAVPLVSAVLSAAAHHDPGTKLLGFFVRKEPKAHGLGQQIEGGFAPGQTVALVEDTCTTGGSLLQALEIVEKARGRVARVLCLVDRDEGAAEAFAARGLRLESLFTRKDLPA
jgi:orotate phosphoribosyltransferase